MTFNPNTIRTFTFGTPVFNARDLTASFHFSLDNYQFTEELQFKLPQSFTALSEERLAALEVALNIASALLGISYYKAAAPSLIDTSALNLTSEEAKFIETVWLNGLGEYAHHNKIDLSERIRIEPTIAQRTSNELTPSDKVLVPIGGGKDSMVTLEALRKNFEVSAFQLGNYPAINRMIKLAKVDELKVIRRIDPLLIELNKEGALNGHIPITAIYSITAVLGAILAGYGAIALSAERSADESNLNEYGRDVNHQWSKGFQFESDFQQLVFQSISPQIDYFSWLRPYSEYAIAEQFSRLTQYHFEFSSCNRSFHLEGARIDGRWCTDCPKCRFVFLIMSPWLESEHLFRIFGHNLLDDRQQLQGFEELLGISGHKPFECVGEYAECALALIKASQMPDIANATLTPHLLEHMNLSASDIAQLEIEYLTPSPRHIIPERFLSI